MEPMQMETEPVERIERFFDKVTAICAGGTDLAEQAFILVIRWTVTGLVALAAVKILYGILLTILAMR